jgi:hypothetical protein
MICRSTTVWLQTLITGMLLQDQRSRAAQSRQLAVSNRHQLWSVAR